MESVEVGRRVPLPAVEEGLGPSPRVVPSTRSTPRAAELSLLATAGMGEGGGVDLPKPITVMAGEAFIAGPEPFECGET